MNASNDKVERTPVSANYTKHSVRHANWTWRKKTRVTEEREREEREKMIHRVKKGVKKPFTYNAIVPER